MKLSKVGYSDEQKEKMKRLEKGFKEGSGKSAWDHAKEFMGISDESNEKRESFPRLRKNMKR